MDKRTKTMIEEGRAMVCGDYTIEAAADIYGNDNGLGVYVFDKNGNVVNELHLNQQTNLLDPVDLEAAINWCEDSNNPTVKDYYGNEINFDDAVQYMDKDICEELNNEMAPCSNQKFIEAYAKAHAEKFDGEEFAPYYNLAW